MRTVLILALCCAFVYGCEDSTEPSHSLNDLLLGSYAGADVYWVPKDSTQYQGMYPTCSLDSTRIELHPNGNFLMRVEARVDHLDTVYTISLSGYYTVTASQYHRGSGWSPNSWTGYIDFSPNGVQQFRVHFQIADFEGSNPTVNHTLRLADSSSFYVISWRRLKFNNGYSWCF